MYDVKGNYAEVVEWQTRCLQAAVRQRVGVQISSSAPFELERQIKSVVFLLYKIKSNGLKLLTYKLACANIPLVSLN